MVCAVSDSWLLDFSRMHIIKNVRMLSEIIELPIMPHKTSKRNITKKVSIILTSTHIKDQLEEKENKKKAKEIKEAEKKHTKIKKD